MKTTIRYCVALVFLLVGTISISSQPIAPDPALVAKYEADKSARDTKLAECKKKSDLAAVLNDVTCVSADRAVKNLFNKNATSKCRVFYLPYGMQPSQVEPYLRKNSPSDAELKACHNGVTRDEWIERELKKRSK